MVPISRTELKAATPSRIVSGATEPSLPFYYPPRKSGARVTPASLSKQAHHRSGTGIHVLGELNPKDNRILRKLGLKR
jgi:hypothetical protein